MNTTQPLLIATFLLSCSVSANAELVVVNFDDLSGQGTFVAPPPNYGGIDWEGPDWGTWTWDGDYYLWHSPFTALLTNSLDIGEAVDYFSFGNPVTFDGAWFSGGGSLQWLLYFQGELVSAVAAIETTVSDTTFYASNYAGLVDRVGLINPRGSIVMDDVTYRTTAPVPLPAAAWLFGGALTGLSLRGRRQVV